MTPGQAERGAHDCVRNGVTSLFGAPDVAAGAVTGKCRRRRRTKELLAFLRPVEKTADIPKGTEAHLILDNHSTPRTPTVERRLTRRPHWRVHFAPTGAG